MRHATRASEAIRTLPVAVIQPAFGAFLVALPRGPDTSAPAGFPACKAAVGMAAVAGPADEEVPLTPAADAGAQTELSGVRGGQRPPCKGAFLRGEPETEGEAGFGAEAYEVVERQ